MFIQKIEKGTYYVCSNDSLWPIRYVNTRTRSFIECSLWNVIYTIVGPIYLFRLERKGLSIDDNLIRIYKVIKYSSKDLILKIAFASIESIHSVERNQLLNAIEKLIKVLDLSALVLVMRDYWITHKEYIFVDKNLCTIWNSLGKVCGDLIIVEDSNEFWESLHSVISEAIRKGSSKYLIIPEDKLDVCEGIKKFFEIMTHSRGHVFELIAYPFLKECFGELESTCPDSYHARLDFRVKHSRTYIEVKYNSWLSPSQISFAIANASELYVFSNTGHIRASTLDKPLKKIKLNGTIENV